MVLLKCSQGTYLNHFLCPSVFLLVSLFYLLHSSPVPGRSVVSTLCLQSVHALKSVLPKILGDSSLPFSAKGNGSVCSSLPCFPLHTFLNICLHLRGFPADQLFSSLGRCGHLVTWFDVSFNMFNVAYLSDVVQCPFLRLFPGPNTKSTTFYICWSVIYGLYTVSPFLLSTPISTHLSLCLHLETDIMDQMDCLCLLPSIQSSSEMYLDHFWIQYVWLIMWQKVQMLTSARIQLCV